MNKKFATVLLVLGVLSATAPLLKAQSEAAKNQEYPSKYKKRGDVHGLVLPLAYPVIYEGVVQAFTKLGLTINYEDPALGYIEGGRSRGIAGEMVRVWIDLEGKDQYRVEVRNLRISRMGLLGFTATKDWSIELLDAINKQLGERPTLAQLRAAVEATPTNMEAHRQLIEGYIASGLLDDAGAAYGTLLAKYPHSHLDRSKYADFLLSRQQAEQAIAILQQAEGADPEIKLNLARLYLQTENHAAAVEVLKSLAQKDPADLKTRYQLARATYLAGDLATAKTTFSGVIEQSPQHPFAEQSTHWLRLLESGAIKKPLEAKATLVLCEMLLKEKLDLLAQRYLESAIATAALPERYALARMLVGIYQTQRQYPAIIRLLESQVEQLKKDKQGELLYALVTAHCGLRNFQPALDYLKLAKKADFKPPKAMEQVLKSYQ